MSWRRAGNSSVFKTRPSVASKISLEVSAIVISMLIIQHAAPAVTLTSNLWRLWNVQPPSTSLYVGTGRKICIVYSDTTGTRWGTGVLNDRLLVLSLSTPTPDHIQHVIRYGPPPKKNNVPELYSHLNNCVEMSLFSSSAVTLKAAVYECINTTWNRKGWRWSWHCPHHEPKHDCELSSSTLAAPSGSLLPVQLVRTHLAS